MLPVKSVCCGDVAGEGGDAVAEDGDHLTGVVPCLGMHSIATDADGTAVAVTQGIHRMIPIAFAAGRAGIGCVTRFGAGGSGHNRMIVMAPGGNMVRSIACAAGCAGMGGIATFGAGGSGHHGSVGVSNSFCFVRHIAVTAGGTGIGGIAALDTGRRCYNGGVMMSCRSDHSTFRCGTDRTDTLFFAILTHRVLCGDPTAISVGMVIPEVILQQGVHEPIGHHFVTRSTRMDTVAPELVNTIILRTDIVEPTDQIQIDHRHIIQCTYFDDGIAQVTQGVTMDICLGLIPISSRSNGVIPRGNHRCHEVELGSLHGLQLAQFLNSLAPHPHSTINGGGVSGIDAAKLVVARSSSAEIIDAHENGHHICVH